MEHFVDTTNSLDLFDFEQLLALTRSQHLNAYHFHFHFGPNLCHFAMKCDYDGDHDRGYRFCLDVMNDPILFDNQKILNIKTHVHTENVKKKKLDCMAQTLFRLGERDRRLYLSRERDGDREREPTKNK